jgi:dienelactone hydrolase
LVHVWYPAQVEPGSRPAPLMEHMPFQFSHLSLVQTHAYQDAPVSSAQASYPVLIFSHGHVGFIEQNLTQFEELASHGYIVCSIAHTYHAIATVFPDGRVVPADPDLANDFLKGNSPNHNVNAEHLRIWVDDTRFLMDELENIQRGAGESLLAGKLDMTRLGIFGQSFGGVTAVQVCSVDDRCQAGINMDGGLPGDYATGVISSRSIQPFMFIFNEGRANYVRTTLGRLTNTAYGITVRGTTHFNFTDLSLYSPVLKITGATGPIDGYRMVKIINAYTLAFFNEYLKGEMSPLLDGPSLDYPEVIIRIRNP